MSRQEWLKLLVKEWSGCDDCYRIKKELSSILDVVQQSANSIAKEIETVQKQADIKRKEAEVEYKKVVAEAQHDVAKVQQAKAVYEATQKHIEDDFKKEGRCSGAVTRFCTHDSVFFNGLWYTKY